MLSAIMNLRIAYIYSHLFPGFGGKALRKETTGKTKMGRWDKNGS
jgi:hypothetical protein